MQCICVPLAVFAHSSFFAVRLTPCSHVSSNNSQGRDYLFLRRRVAIFRGEGIIRGNTVLQLVCIISGTAFACFVNPCTAVLPSHGQFDQD